LASSRDKRRSSSSLGKGAGVSDPLTSYWTLIEPPKRRAADAILDTPENCAPLAVWLLNLGQPGASPILTLPGRDRLGVFERLRVHDAEGSFAGRIRIGEDLPLPFVTGIVRNLMQAPELSVEGPLRDYADKSSHIAHDVYRLLWEGRFILREKPGEFEEFVTQMAKWIGWCSTSAYVERVVSGPQEQAAVLCFLTALAAQNGITKRVILCLDGIDQIEDRGLAKNVMAVLTEVRRWALLTACPFGLLLGFAGSRSDVAKLRKLNPTLGAEVDEGLVWTKK